MIAGTPVPYEELLERLKFWKSHAGETKEQNNKLRKLVTQQAAKIRKLKKQLHNREKKQ
jgi:hypothetical protein